jgi:hypothetical protein
MVTQNGLELKWVMLKKCVPQICGITHFCLELKWVMGKRGIK